MACPEYLRQHIFQHGVQQTLRDIREVTAERKAEASKTMLSFEADEKDHYMARQAISDHEVICAACGDDK